MSAKKMGLGRGLNTLIPKAPIVDEEDVESFTDNESSDAQDEE